MSYPESCDLCPRLCGADRRTGAGLCGGGALARVSKIMIHRFEEPCIGGERGAGTVFFSGCSLGCIYCQNRDISTRDAQGTEMTPARLAEEFEKLEADGACTLDLVTPSHYAPQVREALTLAKIKIPVVYNIGGYERPETVRRYMDKADVFLTDFKYGTPEFGEKYSHAPDYTETAKAALREMYALAGDVMIGDDGIIRHGIVLRHLVLPGGRRDSVKALEAVAETVPTDKIVLSLMSQFTPDFVPAAYPELRRRVTSFEYNYVLDAAISMGFDGYAQDKDSASAKYTPEF